MVDRESVIWRGRLSVLLIASAFALLSGPHARADFGGGTIFSWSYYKSDGKPNSPPVNPTDFDNNHSPPNALPLDGGLPSNFSQPEGVTYTGIAYASPALIGCNAMVATEAVEADTAYSGTVTTQASWQDTIYVQAKNTLKPYLVGS